ncbi:hypothetical protein BLNAU_23192 [Blattamonas nauphoetae]|uniref:Uncharacterized protein n=1 Tax=Blattamonas nauphoetae TaxID=2049346 RepID=A0ABQ9WQW4_9EUKA|nr:hypothetical protein BLNAU_23192 [Blattamonas nauphoetae]
MTDYHFPWTLQYTRLRFLKPEELKLLKQGWMDCCEEGMQDVFFVMLKIESVRRHRPLNGNYIFTCKATPLQIVSSLVSQSQMPTAMSTSFPTLPLGSLSFPSLQQGIEALTGCIRISGKDDNSFLKAHETAVSALSKVLRWLELVQALFEAVINRKRENQPHLISLPPATSPHFIPFLLRKQETPLMDDSEVNHQHIQSVTTQLALLQQQRQHRLAAWSKQLALLVDEEEAVCCRNMLTMDAKEGDPVVLASGEWEGDLQCGMLIAQALNGTFWATSRSCFSIYQRIVSIPVQIFRSSHASEASSPILEEMFQKLSSDLLQDVLHTLWKWSSQFFVASIGGHVDGNEDPEPPDNGRAENEAKTIKDGEWSTPACRHRASGIPCRMSQ